MGEKGEDLKQYLTNKYGPSAERSFGDPNSPLMQMGRNAGIDFKTDRRIFNTVKAHALIEHTKKTVGNNQANEAMEDLYKRYFEAGENISDAKNLVDVFKGIMPEEEAKEVMMAADKRKQVLEKDQQMKRMGIHGVPFFIIEHQDDTRRPVTFSGAVSPSKLAKELRKASQE